MSQFSTLTILSVILIWTVCTTNSADIKFEGCSAAAYNCRSQWNDFYESDFKKPKNYCCYQYKVVECYQANNQDSGCGLNPTELKASCEFYGGKWGSCPLSGGVIAAIIGTVAIVLVVVGIGGYCFYKRRANKN